MDGLSQCAENQRVRADFVARENPTPGVGPTHCVPPWIPNRHKTQWEPLEGRSWKNEYAPELPERVRRSVTRLHTVSGCLTFPLTALWALEKMCSDGGWTKKKTLEIHVSVPSEPFAAEV